MTNHLMTFQGGWGKSLVVERVHWLTVTSWCLSWAVLFQVGQSQRPLDYLHLGYQTPVPADHPIRHPVVLTAPDLVHLGVAVEVLQISVQTIVCADIWLSSLKNLMMSSLLELSTLYSLFRGCKTTTSNVYINTWNRLGGKCSCK